ncbi:MAG: hypothetical protein GW872_05700 [Nitrospirae bacterium]|nr:hypothetical protein [Nitrospirota bacterium]
MRINKINAMDNGVNGKGWVAFLRRSRLRHAAPAHQSIHPEKTDIRRININPTRKIKRGIAAPFERNTRII